MLIKYSKVAKMAVNDINANNSLLTNYDLSLDIKDGKCEPDVVMKMFIDIIRTKAKSRFSFSFFFLFECVNKINQLPQGLLVQILWKLLLVSQSTIALLLSPIAQKVQSLMRTVTSILTSSEL